MAMLGHNFVHYGPFSNNIGHQQSLLFLYFFLCCLNFVAVLPITTCGGWCKIPFGDHWYFGVMKLQVLSCLITIICSVSSHLTQLSVVTIEFHHGCDNPCWFSFHLLHLQRANKHTIGNRVCASAVPCLLVRTMRHDKTQYVSSIWRLQDLQGGSVSTFTFE